MITKMELGWLVGMLEGEGHFRYYSTQEVMFTTTDEDIALKFAKLISEIIEVPCVVKERVEMTTGGKVVYNVNICGERARIVMHAVVRHMGKRRRSQIWRALNKIKSGQKLDIAELVSNIVQMRKA